MNTLYQCFTAGARFVGFSAYRDNEKTQIWNSHDFCVSRPNPSNDGVKLLNTCLTSLLISSYNSRIIHWTDNFDIYFHLWYCVPSGTLPSAGEQPGCGQGALSNQEKGFIIFCKHFSVHILVHILIYIFSKLVLPYIWPPTFSFWKVYWGVIYEAAPSSQARMHTSKTLGWQP